MILLCGIPSEPPLRLVAEAAEREGIAYRLLNQRQMHHIDIELRAESATLGGSLRLCETEWLLERVTGVYSRLMNHRDLPEYGGRGRWKIDAEGMHKADLIQVALDDWIETAGCRVMNRSRAMSSNSSKPYQAQLIERAGLRTPPTLITNDPLEVMGFLEKHTKVIYKSISAVRSIVRTLGDVKMSELWKIRHLPAQFQAYIPGTNVRVHVAGDELFATEIRTEAVDYRYAATEEKEMEMVPVELPVDIQERCFNVSSQLELPLCGIDLKRTPDGEYFCFEVNPSPAFSYYQEMSGQDIAGAIVRYLR